MSQCTITLSASSGVVLRYGDVRIWSDVLHSKKTPDFSTVSPEMWRHLQQDPALIPPDLIVFSHCHPDHYSRELTAQAMKLWPDAQVAIPKREFDRQILITQQRNQLSVRGLSLRFGKLAHDGKGFEDVANYGCIIDNHGFHTLIAGDCAVANPELADFIGDTPIQLALLDFPWATLRKGREFIQKYIHPEHLILYHLPFQADNDYRFREATAQSVSRVSGIPDIRILQDAFQREVIQ
jgi:L-ascorbate metabolism protein UlaG (beta-lactamase superfamily)